MIINDLDGYYIVFDTKNWNTELDTLFNMITFPRCIWNCQFHLLCKGMKKCGVIQVHNGPYMEKVAKQHIFFRGKYVFFISD